MTEFRFWAKRLTPNMSLLHAINRPWLHFIGLGASLFVMKSVLFPPAKTVIGPLSAARVQALEQQWSGGADIALSPTQRASLINTELDRDMLFQRALELNLHLTDGVIFQRLIRNMHFLGMAAEGGDPALFERALEMRLHLDDEVVKRRMIWLMKERLLAENPPVALTRAELFDAFERRSDALRQPPTYTFQHLYFAGDGEEDAAAAVEAIEAQELEFDAARQLGQPFLQGHSFERQTARQLALSLGWDFVREFEQSDPRAQQWLGPIRSSFGWHYLWVADVSPWRDAVFEEVEPRLRIDLEYEAQAEALNSAIAALHDYYDVRGPNTGARDGDSEGAR